MRQTRIYVDTALLPGAELTLPEAAAAHVQRVLRLRPGAELTLFNGAGGEYRAVLLRADRQVTVARVQEHTEVERESPLLLTLLQGVSRGERMDTIVQKSTELGVSRIVPVLCEYSVVRFDAAAATKRREHWRSVAIGACEQCGRNRLPALLEATSLDAALAAETANGMPQLLRVVLAPNATQSLVGAAQQLRTGVAGQRNVTLLIGPEGGLSDKELLLATRAGFVACSLGPRVLRTETAPLAALATLQTILGDFAQDA